MAVLSFQQLLEPKSLNVLTPLYPQAIHQLIWPHYSGQKSWESFLMHLFQTPHLFHQEILWLTFKWISNLTTSPTSHHPDPGLHHTSLRLLPGLLTGLSAYCLAHLEPIFKTASIVIHLKHESDLIPPQSPSMSPHFTNKSRVQLALMLDSVWPFLLDLISYYSPSWRLCFSHTSLLALFTMHQIFT